MAWAAKPIMIWDVDQLQALRNCCRDEVAFAQLQTLLAQISADTTNFSEIVKSLTPPEPQPSKPPTNLLQGVAQATQALLTHSNAPTGVNQALEILGKVTGVSRVYIFEHHRHPETDEPAMSQRFEWSDPHVSAQIDNPLLQNLSYRAAGMTGWYDRLSSGYSASSLVRNLSTVERELLEPQGILSILLVPIPVNGEIWGFIGFDDCQTERQWSTDEEAVLMTMAATLGSFIAHRQALERTAQLQTEYTACLHQITANVPGLIYQLLRRQDGSFGITFASSGCWELFEVEPEAVMTDFSLLTNLLHPNDRSGFFAAMETSAIALQPWRWQGRFTTPSGKLKWVEGISRPERSHSQAAVNEGEILWNGVLIDITERKQTEAALRESEEKFAKAFCSSPDAMAITSVMDGRLIDVNDSFVRVAGYEREEVIGRTVFDLNLWVNLSDRATLMQLLQERGEVRNLEFEFRRKSGAIAVGLFSAEMIHLMGEPYILSVTNDITERKRTEEELLLAVERDRLLGEIALRIRKSLDLNTILNTTVTEVRQFLACDRVFIAYVNATYRGQVVAESVTSNCKSLLGLVPDENFLEEIKAIFEQGEVQIIDDVSQAQLSSLRTEVCTREQIQAILGVPIMVNEQFFGVLVAHQCTAPRHWHRFEIDLLKQLAIQVAIAIQQAELYQQVQLLNTSLESQVEKRTHQLQQKMQELQELYQIKDVFLHAFSHDLRTPIMGMSLVLQNLLNQPEETLSLSRSILERMVESSDRQLNLINSLLEAHSTEVQGILLHCEPVNLSQLMQTIIEDLNPLLNQHQATLINKISPNLPLLNADPIQLRRVYENLVTNALKYNLPGLTLTFNATVENDWIRCTVEDNGIGMTQELCDRLFELYYRGGNTRHYTGIGLGLYLCRQIITAHGGEIGAISSSGNGSIFWFILPYLGTEE